MDTKQNNYAINEFKGGMNSDLSYDVLLPNQYIFGENIRITTNALISEINNSNAKEGSLCPVPDGIEIETNTGVVVKNILAVDSIDNTGVVITQNSDDRWSIYKIILTETCITSHLIFTSRNTVSHDNKFSIVLNKEINEDIILYIADGEHLIMSININNDDYNKNIQNETLFISESYFPMRKIYISEKITGSLNTGQVQYTYRFYKKYGIKSKLAPLTTKLQVIDTQKTIEEGNAVNTETGIGFRLAISTDKYCLDTFDKIQIYRIHYMQNNVNSNIELIYDDYINNRNMIYVNDTGIRAIETYTIDEFTALDGLLLIPLSIELNQNYMFIANVEDITKLKLNNLNFDSRSYLMTQTNEIILHHQNDIEYTGQPLVINYTDVSDLSDIDESMSLNEYSDINIDFDNPKYSDLDFKFCKFDDKKYYGGIGKNISWRFITTPILLQTQEQINDNLPPKQLDSGTLKIYYLNYEDLLHPVKLIDSGRTNRLLFQQHNIFSDLPITYEDPIVSSLFRSLKRDEVYRYGIILYDNNGSRSDVQWIADIRTPDVLTFPITQHIENAQDIDKIGNSSDDYILMEHVLSNFISKPGRITETDIDNQIIDAKKYNKPPTEDTEDSMFISERLTYETNETVSDEIEFKEGQRIRLSCSSGSEIKISGMLYLWCSWWDHTNGKFVKIPDIHVSGSDLQKNISYKVDSMYFNDTKSSVMGMTVELNSYIQLDYNEKIDFHSTDYYTIKQKCKGTIHNSVKITYSRNEFDWTSFLMTANSTFEKPGGFYNLGISSMKYKIEEYEKPELSSKSITGLVAYPLGIQFNVHDLPENIAAYQIVRCEKPELYTKNILQCVAARPIRLMLTPSDSKIKRFSPYYPHHILNAQPYSIVAPGTDGINRTYSGVIPNFSSQFNDSKYNIATADAITNMGSKSERNIFLLYSPEITLARNTTLQKLSNQCFVDFFAYCYYQKQPMPNSSLYEHKNNQDISFIQYTRFIQNFDKSQENYVYSYCNVEEIQVSEYRNECIFKIDGISDVLNPNWEDGFGNVQIGAVDGIAGVVTFANKTYKSYTSTVSDKEYVNWHCNGMYNLKSCLNDSDYGQTSSLAHMLVSNSIDRHPSASGVIGPGPQCYIVSVEDKDYSPIYGMIGVYNLIEDSIDVMGTSCAYICNIIHKASQFSGYTKEDKKYDTYYGFGNFQRVGYGSLLYDVFDGDVYITPFEIILMYKAFNFNDKETLQSAQYVYYVPIESAVNNYFNYGYNYRNTTSTNLLINPGEITGIATQKRPSNQYNFIYSNNNTSNDVYDSESYENQIDKISQRIYYSQQKISGENIDKYTYFKPLDYIDVDTRYGEITHIFGNKDILYCWQLTSFGRIHVNERSLISDLNNNTIQLGTGGVMQRIDYIDLHYGMSNYQHAAVGIEDKIYWIDDKNKAVLVSDGQRAVNLSELLNVQNILNERFDQKCPEIHYDLQNQELLCKCINGNQMIFNIKLNVATSIYTRNYLDILTLNNTVYGINNKLNLIKYNNLCIDDTIMYMPTNIKFVVNKDPSITKVFDNQEIVFSGEYYDENKTNSFLENKTFLFHTNIYESTEIQIEHSINEGNIKYSIPRLNQSLYGNRYRGKWMCVEIKDCGNNTNFAISHIITKFRQSFS